jgi:hypothetical protein
VITSICDDFGGNGGWGEPSALNVRSIVTGLPAERLTDRTTGSTIKTAKTETATASDVFFQGSIPPDKQSKEGQFWRGSVLENVPYAEQVAA